MKSKKSEAMDDGLEMIDRNNSTDSIKRAAAAAFSNDSAFIGHSAKPKTSSMSSSSDSASNSGSFNDIGVAPPGYNLFDESMTGSSYHHDESGPHRELPVDVPDSFVGTIKQTPRYPPLPTHTPSVSTFKPGLPPPPLPLKHDEAYKRIAPFSLHDEDESPRVGSDARITNGINPVHKSMQPQPQTPSVSKDKVLLCSISFR